MPITILALGSRGDAQPFVPLGIALQNAGERVRVATFELFATASPVFSTENLPFAIAYSVVSTENAICATA